jgi:hypothetical protein
MRAVSKNMQAASQGASVRNSLILYGSGNNQGFVGLDENGDEAFLNDSELPNGYEVDERFETLIRDSYFSSQMLISPAEIKTAWTTGNLTTSQYSFALLAIDDDEERVEWRDSINPLAIVVSDRAATGTSSADLTSVWTTSPGSWKGVKAYSDGHTMFDNKHVDPVTKYGNHSNRDDDIFEDAHPDTGDAIMAYYGKRGVFPE